MLGVAAALLIVMVLAGGALIYDGGRALVAQRQIINVAEGAARAGTEHDRPKAACNRARRPPPPKRSSTQPACPTAMSCRSPSPRTGSP